MKRFIRLEKHLASNQSRSVTWKRKEWIALNMIHSILPKSQSGFNCSNFNTSFNNVIQTFIIFSRDSRLNYIWCMLSPFVLRIPYTIQVVVVSKCVKIGDKSWVLFVMFARLVAAAHDRALLVMHLPILTNQLVSFLAKFIYLSETRLKFLQVLCTAPPLPLALRTRFLSSSAIVDRIII